MYKRIVIAVTVIALSTIAVVAHAEFQFFGKKKISDKALINQRILDLIKDVSVMTRTIPLSSIESLEIIVVKDDYATLLIKGKGAEGEDYTVGYGRDFAKTHALLHFLKDAVSQCSDMSIKLSGYLGENVIDVYSAFEIPHIAGETGYPVFCRVQHEL